VKSFPQRSLSLLIVATVAAAFCRSSDSNAQGAFLSGHQPDPNQVSLLNACVTQTTSDLQTASETLCTGQNYPHYFEAGNTDDDTNVINYSLQDFPYYQYISGTQAAKILDGECTFDMNGTSITSPTNFACSWHVAGCGPLKAGGHIKGYCSVKIHYMPQSWDVIRVKEYCFAATILGLPATRPGTFPGSCILP
jgi:hypothetical protein